MPWQPGPAAAGALALASDTAEAPAAHSDVALFSAVPPRVLTYVALALMVGAAVWRLWVVPRAMPACPNDGGPARRAHPAVALAGALGAAAGLVAAAWSLAAQLGSLDEGAGMLMVVVAQTHWGRVWLAQTLAFTGAASAYGLAARAERRRLPAAQPVLTPWVVAAAASVGAAGLQGALGHAATTGGSSLAAVLLAGVHVAAAAAWIGTLAVLALTWRLDVAPPADRTPATRLLAPAAVVASQVAAFHPVALTAATVTALAGAGNAWLRLSGAPGTETSGFAARAAALPGTAYGRLLLVKLAFAGLVAVFGAVNARSARARRAARRRGAVDPAPDVAALTRTARLELAAALVVFVLSAALAVSTPPGAE